MAKPEELILDLGLDELQAKPTSPAVLRSGLPLFESKPFGRCLLLSLGGPWDLW